jgi:hypothetical protein
MSRIIRTCEIASHGNAALHHPQPEIAMSFAPESETPAAATLAGSEAMLRVPVGLASPLWGLFAGAAMSGATWWWMTRWARPENLEAMFGAAETLDAVVEPAVEPIIEAVAEPMPEPVVEAPRETVAEALIEASPAPEAVGGESGPISPVLEAIVGDLPEPEVVAGGAADVALEHEPAPKPRKKAAAPPVSDTPAS